MNGPFKKTRHTKRKGRCFELAADYIFREGSEKFLLVHGYRQIDIISTNGHAWIEDEQTQTVYDLVENEVFHRDDYYKDNNIHDVTKYSLTEAAEKLSQTGDAGPWNYQEMWEKK